VAVLFKATEQALGKKAFWRRLQRMLERADVPLRAVEFAYLIAGCGLGAGIVAAGLRLQSLVILASMVVGAFIPYAVVGLKARRRLRAFENQLPDLLVTMAASLKAGHSFRQGMQTLVDEGAEPASKEFKRVLTETQLGRSMDDALTEMADRIGSKDLEFAVTSVTIQRQVGGSLAGLFDMIAETVRNRQQFGRKIKGLTSMGRASAYVLIALPFFVALAITAINSEYMSPLWHTSTGQKLIGLGLVMMACGASMLRKIVSFRG
jgi:tight adherence protein B